VEVQVVAVDAGIDACRQRRLLLHQRAREEIAAVHGAVLAGRVDDDAAGVAIAEQLGQARIQALRQLRVFLHALHGFVAVAGLPMPATP
jgi:hypothetical protein